MHAGPRHVRGAGDALQLSVTVVMRAIPPLLSAFDIAALSPSDAGFYARLGWEMWRGPRRYLKDGVCVETPEEEVMVRHGCERATAIARVSAESAPRRVSSIRRGISMSGNVPRPFGPGRTAFTYPNICTNASIREFGSTIEALSPDVFPS